MRDKKTLAFWGALCDSHHKPPATCHALAIPIARTTTATPQIINHFICKIMQDCVFFSEPNGITPIVPPHQIPFIIPFIFG